jgi:acyl-CoA reductase-like NAD-dependent aldehyde dehydrogenase
VFTVVYGGGDAAQALLDSVDAVSFTGSDAVGRSVAARAGARGIPAQCEMGGQNAAIVFDDADPPGPQGSSRARRWATRARSAPPRAG